MKVAFFGDVHGRVLHALGAAVMLQKRRGIRLDAMVQVGDLGSYPSAERLDEATRRFIVGNPAEGDFFRLLQPSPRLAEGVRWPLSRFRRSTSSAATTRTTHGWPRCIRRSAPS